MSDSIIRISIESNPPDEFVIIQTGRQENQVWFRVDDLPRVISMLQRLLTKRAADGVDVYTGKELAEELVKRGYEGKLTPRR